MTPTVQTHVAGCDFCRLVRDVWDQIKNDDDACQIYDVHFAARGDGALNAAGRNQLQRHLASCEACRELDELEEPDTDSTPVGLPSIDGDAYTLGLEVGRGGMGRVIDARDRRVGRSVVIKELLGDSQSHAARFEREARLTARLQHPGIVPIYEIGKWSSDGTPFYAMRKIEGRNFEEAIAKASTLPARVVLLPSLIAACETIAFAHSKCVIHRDLKPTNIMLGDYGETIVIDWGLAKDLNDATDGMSMTEDTPDAGASDRLTGVGQAIGTPAYMPPEQTYGTDVDTRSDVYAIGAMLYQLLAGVPPYRGDSGNSILRAVRAGPPQPIEEVALGAPRELVSIVTKAMARKPEDRYPSAKELADELKRFQKGLLVEAHTYSRGELVKRFVKRNRAALVATSLAFAVLAVVTVFYVRGIIRSNREARETVRELVFEKGRNELLAGNHVRALAYLHEASSQGESGPELQLLLGAAAANLAAREDVLDCRGDDRYLEVSADGMLLGVACHDRARVWRIKTPAGAILEHPEPLAILEVPNTTAGFDDLTFSRDGTLLATWGAEGVARLWKVDAIVAGRPAVLREFHHRQPGKKLARITFATFTSDNRRVATTGVDGFAQIWNVETGIGERSINGVAVDGALGALGPLSGKLTADDKLVSLTYFGSGAKYDPMTGALLGTFNHGSNVAGGAASPDGKYAVTCGQNGKVKVIDLEKEVLFADLEAHTDVVWRCAFDSTGRRVLTSSHDGTSKVWQLGESGASLVATAHHGDGDVVWIGRFSPDGSRFVTISPGKNMKVWDSTSGALLATYTSRGKDAQFLPDNRLAALTGNGHVQIWSSVSTRLTAFSPAVQADGDEILGASRDARALVTYDSMRRGLRVWRPTGERLASELPLQGPIASANDRIAAIYVDETTWGIGIVETSGARPKRLIIETSTKPRLPSVLALSAEGNRIALMWPDRDAQIWDLSRSTKVATLSGARPGERSRVLLDDTGARAVVWRERDSDDGTQTLLVGSPVIWDVDANRALLTITATGVRPIGFALGGKRLVMVGRNEALSQNAMIWDLETNRALRVQESVDTPPTIDPKGHYVTTIDRERDVTVWDAQTGASHNRFSADLLQQVEANADGSLVVAVAEYGRAVLILSASDGRVLARHELEHASAEVNTESFRAPRSIAWWTPDSAQVANIAKGFASWRAANLYDAAKLAKLVKQLPWRIENGRLQAIRNGRIVGRVTRAGEAVPGAAVELLMRRPADLSDKAANWESMKTRQDSQRRTTDAEGRFSIDNLPVGDFEYRVTVTSGSSTPKNQEVIVEPEPEEIPLALD